MSDLAHAVRQSSERVVEYLKANLDEKAFQAFSDEFFPPTPADVLLASAAELVERAGRADLVPTLQEAVDYARATAEELLVSGASGDALRDDEGSSIDGKPA